MRLSLVAMTLLLSAACTGGDAPAPADPAEAEEAAVEEAAPAKPASPASSEAAPEAAAGAEASGLLDPSSIDQQAPETYTVKMALSTGDVLIDVTRAWAPKGADRFYSLVKAGYFEDLGIFRVVPGFVIQFGLHGDPAVNQVWRKARIPDDAVEQTNRRGTLTFATSGPNSRTTQLFINLGDNANLDGMGFAPFGVVRDMGPVDKVTSEYGQRPNQGRITMEGNAYLKQAFPNLDYVTKTEIVEE